MELQVIKDKLVTLESLIVASMTKTEALDKYVLRNVQKYILISVFLISIMTIYTMLFGAWAIYSSNQGSSIMPAILSLEKQIAASLTEHKAIAEGTAENNYNITKSYVESLEYSNKIIEGINVLQSNERKDHDKRIIEFNKRK